MKLDKNPPRRTTLHAGVTPHPDDAKFDWRNKAEPARRAEIPEALEHLDQQIQRTEELAKQVEQRLCAVLRPTSPEAAGKSGILTSTSHGQTLRELGSRAGTTGAILADILDRLEM